MVVLLFVWDFPKLNTASEGARVELDPGFDAAGVNPNPEAVVVVLVLDAAFPKAKSAGN